MYYTHIKDLVTDDPYPMYQDVTELIEADGEAEEIFLDNCVANGYVERYFTAIDDHSEDDIQLDITDYIGLNTYYLFENVIDNVEANEEISYTKANSWYIACLKAKR